MPGIARGHLSDGILESLSMKATQKKAEPKERMRKNESKVEIGREKGGETD